MAVNLKHGNRLRPPDKAYEVKKQRARNAYADAQMAKNKFWFNEKILRKNYNLHGGNPLEIIFLSDQGFDFNLGDIKDEIEGKTVFMMKKFGYFFNDTKTIIIWKF
jgi:hypothetical protein